MKILFSIVFMALNLVAFGQVSERYTTKALSEEQCVSKLESVTKQIAEGGKIDFRTLQAEVDETMAQVIESRAKQPAKDKNVRVEKSQQQSVRRPSRNRDKYLQEKTRLKEERASAKSEEQLARVKDQRLKRIRQDVLSVDQNDVDRNAKINQLTLKFLKTLQHEAQR